MKLGAGGILVVVALLATAAFAAAPTRDAYIKQVDPICKRNAKHVTAAVRKFTKAAKRDDFDAAAKHLRDAARVYRGGLRRVKRVDPPAKDARLIDRWLHLVASEIRTFERVASAFDDERFDDAQDQIKRTNRIDKRIRSLVGGYGFRYCA